MAETLTYDPTPPAEVLSSIEADQAESLAIGEAMLAEQEGLLAGKYKDAAELERAYIELQKKLGGGSDEEEGEYEEGDDSEQEYEDNEYDEDTDEAVNLLSKLSEELEANGEFSEEVLNQIDQLSSRDLLDAYFRYQEKFGGEVQEQQSQAVQLTDAQVNQVKNSVGGEAAYQQLTSWAADNFTPEEIQAFDLVCESGNMSAINLALQALYYRYTDAMGYEGETLQGKPARSMDVFRSQAEVVNAMSDPRYDRDPAYRQDIIDKLSRSDIDF